MSPWVCTQAWHEQIVSDDYLLVTETEPVRGSNGCIQHMHGYAPDVMLTNCRRCGSTLGVNVDDAQPLTPYVSLEPYGEAFMLIGLAAAHWSTRACEQAAP